MGDIHGNPNLPPGFHFSPTDEELVLHFLHRKASLLPSHPNINIPDLDVTTLHHPWEINDRAFSSGNKFYFFSKARENKVTENGYWKELDIVEPINMSATSKQVGFKKYLVFTTAGCTEAPDEQVIDQTGWTMQEYHLCSYGLSNTKYLSSNKNRRRRKTTDYNEWVLCKVFYEMPADSNYQQSVSCYNDDDARTELSWTDEMFISLDDDVNEIINFVSD